MDWLKSKTTILAICLVTVAGLLGYGLLSMQSSMEDGFGSMEDEYARADERMTQLALDMDVLAEKLGVTEQELLDAQKLSKQLELENDRFRRALTGKADAKTVAEIRKEASSKIDAVHQEASSKIDGISGDVKGVRTDLDATRTDLRATRTDLDSTRSDLKATRDDVANSRRELGTLIARNSSELTELRLKGDRNYIEFEIPKSKQSNRVGDVMVQLTKTDVKHQKYEIVITADDKAMEKKGRYANEPVTFLVGRDRLRYELVVNSVDKDKIRGYISSPKGKLTAAQVLQ